MAAARVERRLAAIMAADVAGYSRLMAQDEAGTFARLKRMRRELVEPVLARHGGRFVDLKGDGAIVEFRSAVEAVEAAVEIQQAMRAQNADLPEAERIRYRIGINLGDVIVDGDTIHGDGVNIAARIEAMCEPGGIWLARNVHDQVKGKLDLAMAPAGRHRVKNISEPIETFRVLLDGAPPAASRAASSARRLRLPVAAAFLALLFLGSIWHHLPGGPAPTKPAVAVLPFESLDGDETTRRLADGITEDIITDLARFRDLDVIARNSTRVYQGKPVDVRRVGDELGVGYVLEGSLRRQGDRVRVSAQLIDAGSSTHLWSERWDRPVEDLFAVQAEVAERVASSLGGYGLIAEAGRMTARRKPPENLTAYELYLLGVEAKLHGTREGLEEGIRLLRRAVALDPQLARAWTALAWACWSRARSPPAPRAEELRRAAMDAARRALALDPTDAEAHLVFGTLLAEQEGELAHAKVAFEKALQLNPNHILVLSQWAGWGSSFGEPERGAEAADRVIRLDPNYPSWAVSSIGYAFFMVGRYEDALKALARKPKPLWQRNNYVIEAASLAGLGHTVEAGAAAASAMARFPELSIEAHLSRPDMIDHERRRFVETMRAAGFRVCATAEELAKLERPIRLPKCDAERAKAAAARS